MRTTKVLFNMINVTIDSFAGEFSSVETVSARKDNKDNSYAVVGYNVNGFDKEAKLLIRRRDDRNAFIAAKYLKYDSLDDLPEELDAEFVEYVRSNDDIRYKHVNMKKKEVYNYTVEAEGWVFVSIDDNRKPMYHNSVVMGKEGDLNSLEVKKSLVVTKRIEFLRGDMMDDQELLKFLHKSYTIVKECDLDKVK